MWSCVVYMSQCFPLQTPRLYLSLAGYAFSDVEPTFWPTPHSSSPLLISITLSLMKHQVCGCKANCLPQNWLNFTLLEHHSWMRHKDVKNPHTLSHLPPAGSPHSDRPLRSNSVKSSMGVCAAHCTAYDTHSNVNKLRWCKYKQRGLRMDLFWGLFYCFRTGFLGSDQTITLSDFNSLVMQHHLWFDAKVKENHNEHC